MECLRVFIWNERKGRLRIIQAFGEVLVGLQYSELSSSVIFTARLSGLIQHG